MLRPASLIAPCALVLLLAPAALAAPQGRTASIDPAIERALHAGVPGQRSARGQAEVIIVLDADADAAMLSRLHAAGANLHKAEGRTLSHRRFVPTRIDAAALENLARLKGVRRIALAPARSPLPMEHSAALLALDAARGARPALDLLTGKGIVVADLDSNAEVFHPQFFNADAGWFDWIDVNANGALDPGVDAIDLDRDGKAGAKEKAVLLRQQTMYAWYGDFVDARPDGFDPSIDWLYFDDNGNKERDYGKDKGFDDKSAALGEPLFVPDDVNRNGKIDVGERVARLGTSKFKKIYVHIENWGSFDHVFERGVDLSSHINNYTEGAYGFDEALHGSGVLSIVAGDVPLVGRRWVGIAPDADLILGYELASSTGVGLTWALEQKPDVVLHEMAAWTGVPLDGSDVLSTMVDESVQKDQVTHSCPVGNTGGARKHAQVQVAAGAEKTFTFDIPSFGSQGNANYVQLSLNIRGAAGLPVRIQEPDGSSYDLSAAASGYLGNGALYWSTKETSSRGTYFFDLYLYSDQSAKAPAIGTWTVTLTGDAQKAAHVDAYLMDDISSWGLGAAFPPSIADDTRTIGVPATSDHCIAVGAHPGHPSSSAEPWFGDEPEAQTEVRSYSGRGPRIDGVQKPDVLAPDNPFVAAPHIIGGAYGDTPFGGVWPFGGTSGAGPHVTGVTALLAQAGVRGDAAREAIRSGAIKDPVAGTVPNYDYGWGRLSAAGAFGASDKGAPPALQLVAVPASAAAGAQIELRPTATDADGDTGSLQLKWDDGYDGSWDTEYAAVTPRVVTKTGEAREPFKARVRDGSGRIAEAVVWVGVAPPVEPDAGPTDGGATDGDAPEGGIPAVIVGGSGGGEDGCGCRAAGRSPRAWWLFGALAAAAGLASRRRR